MFDYRVISNVMEADADPQLTVALAVPGFVVEPVRQVHCNRPESSAEAGPRPLDRLCAPLGNVTERLQVSSGEVWAVRDALDPAGTGEVTEVILTELA
jgi:hypothetical protein